MELKDSQFLKIRAIDGFIVLRLCELVERGERPKQMFGSVRISDLASRRKKEWKQNFLIYAVAQVKFEFFSKYYPAQTVENLTKAIDRELESEFHRP